MDQMRLRTQIGGWGSAAGPAGLSFASLLPAGMMTTEDGDERSSLLRWDLRQASADKGGGATRHPEARRAEFTLEF